MAQHRFPPAMAIASLLVLISTLGSLNAETTADGWLQSSGKDLTVCLTGEVFDPDGKPATDFDMTGGMNGEGARLPFAPEVEDHRFKVCVPVNQLRWYSMWLKAASSDNNRMAYKRLNAFELRQTAIDGIKLTLQPPTRHVEIKVIAEGQPVAGATVKADLSFGIELRSLTDADGIARFGLLAEQELSGLTAWTEDFRIGGYSFHRKPTRDPAADEHTVELSHCRAQILRFIDEEGAPVPGVEFVVQMATAPPDYNFIGTNEHSRMTTNAAGEVVDKWFPDWNAHYFYPELKSKGWVIDGESKTVDGKIVFTLKRSRDRGQAHGRLLSTDVEVGGFYVTLRSFEGEREDYSDLVSAFTDPDGTFSVDVLPGATYCAYVLDSQWVGEIIDLIPYGSESDNTTPIALTVAKGQEVEVIATTGPAKKPYSNLGISFRREHSYSWRENGHTQNGTSGPQWWATTDETGRATTRTLPGQLEVSVYTPLWRVQESVEVKRGEAAKLSIHREVEEKRKVSGRLVLAEGLDSSLENAEIEVGAVDGNYDDRQTLTCGKDGSFSLATMATEIGVFGYTQDGKAAGSIVTKHLESPIEVRLRPTVEYFGYLAGKDNLPLGGHGVQASIRVEGEEDYNGMFVKGFLAKELRSKTDENGTYTLSGVPCEMKVTIYADAIDGSEDRTRLEEIYLEPNESRPLNISRLEERSKAVDDTPLAERFERTMRDCKLMGFRVMMITSSNGKNVTEFIDQNFMDYQANKVVSSFMQIVVSKDRDDLRPADALFLEECHCGLPEDGRVLACAFDADGNELGRLEVDVADESAIEQVADFVDRQAPPRVDALAKWQEAFSEAKRTDRRVWARISQRYCGPCFLLARWLDDQHELLAKDYVILKIDDVRDQNGAEIAQRLTRGKAQGVPFHAIFDSDEQLLTDSEGPLGNIGHPSDFEGIKQIRKMLLATRRTLTDTDIERLVVSLEE